MGKRRFERKSKSRPEPVTYCVVVEGIETEKNYFNDAKADFDSLQNGYRKEAKDSGVLRTRSCSLQIIPAGGVSFCHVVDVALRQVGLGHARIWCVVDADFYIRLTSKEKTDALNRYNKALAAGIDVIFSTPCFEVWYRLHHECQDAAWLDGKTAKVHIVKLWPEYDTKPDKHWELLKEKIEVAIENAEAVRKTKGVPPKLVEDCDASTDVDRVLMDLFFGINPNDPTQDGALYT